MTPQPLARVAVGDSFSFGVGVDYEQTFSVVLDESCSRPSFIILPYLALHLIRCGSARVTMHYFTNLLTHSLPDPQSFDRSQEAYRLPEGWNKPTFHLVHGALVQKIRGGLPRRIDSLLQHHSVMEAEPLRLPHHCQHLPYSEWWHLNIAILQQIRADANMQQMQVLFVLIPTYYEPRFPALNAYMKQQGLRFIDLSEAQGLTGRPCTIPMMVI